jgi:hypothetical protein
MAAKKKKSTVAKQVSISELQSFIEGATAFNSDDWHPNKEQWTRIVEMIMTIKPEETAVVSNVPHVVNVPQSYPTQQTPQRQFQPSTFGDGDADGGGYVHNASSVADGGFEDLRSTAPRTDMRKIKAEKTGVGGVDDNGITVSGIKVKTPNVDSSKGDYDTPFA